jgi:hypothetical protein
MATTASPSATPILATPPAAANRAWPPGEILRDIARGGVAGLIAGILVAGVGGRVVMRLAAIQVPDAAGLATDNGNRIGDITLAGSLSLVLLGLGIGAVVGGLWVAISPWIPGTGATKALVAMPVAVALGSFTLIDGHNPDFFILDHDPVVVGILVLLIALMGLAIALIDAWLGRHLPHARTRNSRASWAYGIVTLLGMIIALPALLASFLGPTRVVMGFALLVAGSATLAWWYQRAQGADRPERWVARLGRGALAVAVLLGLVQLWGDLRLALLL